LNTAAPITGEDTTPGSPGAILTRNVTGSGSITVSTDQPVYYCGPTVQLTAVPAAGWTFSSWGGDLSGTDPQQTLSMSQSRTISATFVPEATGPVISGIQITPGTTSALVQWNTDVPATSRVAYGATTAYGSEISDPALVTSHALSITGLAPNQTYHLQITSADAAGRPTSSPDQIFTTLPDAVGIVSDDFNACGLRPHWTVVDPRGGSTVSISGVGTTNALL